MNPEVEARLKAYRTDFEMEVGRRVDHFFCPILHVDEGVELQKGHIVNHAFERSARAWVVQRSDVDNFFGAMFEADFVKLQDMQKVTMADLFLDARLNRQHRPSILRNDEPVTYTTRQGELPEVFTPVTLGDDAQSLVIGVKMSPEELLATAGDKWELAVSSDVRIPALVSLIKTAHLTLFHQLGYRYAAFPAGRFIGRDILGRFFRENVKKARQEVLARAHEYFREFVHMVRPVGLNGMNFEGTVSDRLMLVCVGASGRHWAFVVFVKTDQLTHAVLMPTLSNDEAAATYLDFLKNDNENITVTTGRYERSKRIWELNPHYKPLTWPKTGILLADPIEVI